MKTAAQVLEAFDNIRRAQRAGVYAPHKPLLILLALARIQRGEPRLVEFSAIDRPLQSLLAEFGPSGAAKSRHYPFWHLATDGQGALWDLHGPRELLSRRAGATPSLGELRTLHVQGGFPAAIDEAMRQVPGLVEAVAARVLEANFPSTLHADIATAVGLDLDRPLNAVASDLATPSDNSSSRRRRDPGFRERVLRAYEFRCCVCGFDLRLGHVSAGIEAAHIHWHQFGGPEIEPNGLALCALHHKLFDIGAFTIEPAEHRIVFSQHAIAGNRSESGELQFHGRRLLAPQQSDMRPAAEYLAWNASSVFKKPARAVDPTHVD